MYLKVIKTKDSEEFSFFFFRWDKVVIVSAVKQTESESLK